MAPSLRLTDQTMALHPIALRKFVKNRLSLLGKTQTWLAEQVFGASETGIAKSSKLSLVLRGGRALSFEEAQLMAIALAVDLRELSQQGGEDMPITDHIVPLAGIIGDDGLVTPAPKPAPPEKPGQTPRGSVAIPGFGYVPGEAYLVDTRTLMPRYDPGTVLFVTAEDAPHPDQLIGQECIVTTVDGLRALRFLQPGNRPGAYTLVSIISHDVATDVSVSHAAPVTWSHRAR